MRPSDLGARYARAFFEVAKESGQQEAALNQVRSLAAAFHADTEMRELVSSPLLRAEDALEAIKKALQGRDLLDCTKSFLELVAGNGRLSLLPEITLALEGEVDRANGIVRGQVSSPTALKPEERSKIEGFISKVAGKKALLEYHEDPSLIGGLVARVGSYSFDDSLETQMRLLKEHVNKGAL